MSDTVITPEALKQSNFREILAKDLYSPNCGDVDEAFIFIYPSPDPMDEINGDGQLLEVFDVLQDCSKAFTLHRTIDITPETKLYVR